MTIRRVLPSSLSCCKNCIISADVPESKAPVGSSANKSLGSEASALAIATLCFWPPDNSLGRCFAQSLRPTLSKLFFLKKSSELLDQEDIKTIIKTPGLNKSTISEVFFELCTAETDSDESKQLFSNFLNVLSENKRLNTLKMVSNQFEQKKQQAEQTSEVFLTSAAKLPEDDVEQIKQALSKKM